MVVAILIRYVPRIKIFNEQYQIPYLQIRETFYLLINMFMIISYNLVPLRNSSAVMRRLPAGCNDSISTALSTAPM